MDAISLHQAGICNVVASLGTALTESQGRLLQRYAEEIIIAYDTDAAGKEATLRGLDLLDSIGCKVKVLELPSGKDPDEFVKNNGPEGLRKAIENALNLVDYKIKVLKNPLDMEKIEHRIKLMNEIANILAKISNNVEREIYIKKTARENDISEEALSAEVTKKIRSQSGRKVTEGKVNDLTGIVDSYQGAAVEDILSGKAAVSSIPELERMLLVLLCKDNTVLKIIENGLSGEEFDMANRAAFDCAKERIHNKLNLTAGDLITEFEDLALKAFTRLAATIEGYTDIAKATDDIIKKIKMYRLDFRKNEIITLLESGNAGEKAEQLKTELKKLLRERMC
jgi:DNA primase